MPINQEWIQNGINNDAINWANELGNRLSTPAGPKKPSRHPKSENSLGSSNAYK